MRRQPSGPRHPPSAPHADHATPRTACPTLCCSAPYWFHLVRYTTRIHAVALLMAASYTTGGPHGSGVEQVAGCGAAGIGRRARLRTGRPGACLGGSTPAPSCMPAPSLPPPSRPPAVALSPSRGWQLLGVVFASLQGGLGEASCLAMTSYYRCRCDGTATIILPAVLPW